MSEIGKKIDQVIKLGIAEYFKSQGFKKSGRRWSKQVDDNWLLVSVQASSVNKGVEGKFAVNLGIYNSAVEQLAERFHYRDGEIPRAEGSTLECRLNTLGYDRYHWWEIDANTYLKSVSDDVVEKMYNVGMPWLLRCNDLNMISDALRDEHSTGSFSAPLLLGDRPEAIRRIKKAIEERPGGSEHFMAWSKNAGLEIN